MELAKPAEDQSCMICNSKKLHYYFSMNTYRVINCALCGLISLNPQPSPQDLEEIYNENYFLACTEKSEVSNLKSITADRYLNILEEYSGLPLKGKLLEIGCGQGDFLRQALLKNLQVTGIDISPHAIKMTAEKTGSKANLLLGDLSQLIERGESYEYIVFLDVLEHVVDPQAFLKQAHKLLTSNGIILAVVPSTDSFSARLLKHRWMEFKVEHLWYFSQSNLTRLLYLTGFGSTQIFPAKKTVNYNYINEHFMRYPIQPFTKILTSFSNFIPNFIKKHPFNMHGAGIIALSRKKEFSHVKKLSVVMAVYNEEKTVKLIIDRVLKKRIKNLEIELIVVESNSTDKTREILSQYTNHEKIKIIWQDVPLGKGHAIREGFKHIEGDYVLIQDADDEYDIEDYDALIEPLMTGEAAFVLGARHGGRAWKMRKFTDQPFVGHLLNVGHWFFTSLINLLFRLKLKDPFTMYKIFRSDCLEGITFECNRFDFDHELLIKLVKKGYKPIEIPVNYRSRSFKSGKKIDIYRDPLTWLKAIIKYRIQ